MKDIQNDVYNDKNLYLNSTTFDVDDKDFSSDIKLNKCRNNANKSSSQKIGIINNFNIFRRRINFIDNVNKLQVLQHLHFLSIDVNITMHELICNSIMHYNKVVETSKAYRVKNYITLQERDIAMMCLHYNAANYLYNSNPNEYLFEMHYIQCHPVTIFMTKLLLFYLYQDFFKEKIKDYKIDHSDITDVTIMAIIYQKLIEVSSCFDNCQQLKVM